MKKTVIRAVSFIIAAVALVLPVLAEVDIGRVGTFYGGEQVDCDGTVLKEMISDLIDTESVIDSYKKHIEMFDNVRAKAKNIRIDTSGFFVVYSAKCEYFSELFSGKDDLECDAQRNKDATFGHPMVRVPVLADVGEIKNRVIGCIDVNYNSFKGEYEYSCVYMGLPRDFADGADMNLTYLEDLADARFLQNECARLGLGIAVDAWLIRLDSMPAFYYKIIVAVQTLDGIHVIDYFNTVQAEEYGYDRDKAKVYTADDYFAKRSKYEAQWEHNVQKNNLYGISEVSNIFMNSGVPQAFDAVMYGSVAVIGAACLIGVFALVRFVLIKNKKRKGEGGCKP